MGIPAPDWQDRLQQQAETLKKRQANAAKNWSKNFPLKNNIPGFHEYKWRPEEYRWEDYNKPYEFRPLEKKKPDPKLVVVDLTTDQVRALLENPEEGVQVTLEGYVVLIREV